MIISRIKRILGSSVMAFLKNIENLRAIDWGQKFLWDVKFPDAPFPFNDFFPASSVKEDLALIETFEFERYLTRFAIPKGTGLRKLSISFFDDNNYSLQTWIKNWMNKTILNQNYAIATLKTAVKDVIIVRQERTRKDDVISVAYSVFPFGLFSLDADSSSELIEYTVDFYIVGASEHFKNPVLGEEAEIIDIYMQKSETKFA